MLNLIPTGIFSLIKMRIRPMYFNLHSISCIVLLCEKLTIIFFIFLALHADWDFSNVIFEYYTLNLKYEYSVKRIVRSFIA